jgi:hypothetical protein
VCTEAVSTSIREDVEGESLWRTSGGGGARFCEWGLELVCCMFPGGSSVECWSLV